MQDRDSLFMPRLSCRDFHAALFMPSCRKKPCGRHEEDAGTDGLVFRHEIHFPTLWTNVCMYGLGRETYFVVCVGNAAKYPRVHMRENTANCAAKYPVSGTACRGECLKRERYGKTSACDGPGYSCGTERRETANAVMKCSSSRACPRFHIFCWGREIETCGVG